MTTFDPSGNHVVSVHSVLQALRVNLTTARRALVEQVATQNSAMYDRVDSSLTGDTHALSTLRRSSTTCPMATAPSL